MANRDFSEGFAFVYMNRQEFINHYKNIKLESDNQLTIVDSLNNMRQHMEKLIKKFRLKTTNGS